MTLLIMAGLTFLRTLFFHSPWLCCFVRLLLGGVFVAAGTVKLFEPRAFARIISAYGLLPEELLVPWAIGPPWIELRLGLGLQFNIRGSLMAVCTLLTCSLFALACSARENLNVRLRLFFTA